MNPKQQLLNKFAAVAEHMLENAPVEGISPEGISALLAASAFIQIREHTQNADFVKDIQSFHLKFRQTYLGPMRMIDKDLEWRVKFLVEELNELQRAVTKKDLVEQVDALVDLIYVAIGTLDLMNVPVHAAWNEVHRSNMTKTYVEKNGKHGKTVMKGEGYTSPNLKGVLNL